MYEELQFTAYYYTCIICTHIQVDVMYRKYMEKLKSPLYSTLPARELWTEIDRETVTMGCLVCVTK